MTKQVTTSSAAITTAEIKVQTLSIGRKQLTLAVFRQLRQAPLIAEDGSLNGIPWGEVNYHPDKCDFHSDGPHWHVVWQRDDLLFRDTVPSQLRGSTVLWETYSDAGRFVDAWCLDWLRRSTHTYAGPHPGDIFRGTGSRNSAEVIFDHRDRKLGAELSREANDAVRSRRDLDEGLKTESGPREWTKERAAKTFAALDDRVQGSGVTTLSKATDLLDKAVEAELQRRQRYRETYAVLTQLPQLFIAV